MAIETIILLALFTLVPLMEQWWRTRRERRERARRRAQGLPPTPPSVPLPPPIPRVPPGHVPLPTRARDGDDDDEEDEDEAPVVVIRRPPARLPVRLRPLSADAARRAEVALPVSRQRRRRYRFMGREAERHAIVAMAVFGPCRANEPYE